MDKLTILKCRGDYKATKKFIAQPDGSAKKISFKAGSMFNREEKPVSSLETLSKVLEELLDRPESFVIRGMAKQSTENITRRKNIFFDEVPRHYVMLDIDKLPCPVHFDVAQNPEEAVKWVVEHLPAPFKKVSCYYTFSSSQNIRTSSSLSVHLWFWLDRAILGNEWKRYFKENPAPVDQSLFSTVHIHYTARPIFQGVNDPLPIRSGILKGARDSVPPLDIPPPKEPHLRLRPEKEPEVTRENKEKAIIFLLPYHKEGQRDRFCGAIAGALYRGG